MSKGMIYNSRLMPNELDKWFKMCETAGVEVSSVLRKHIATFAQIEDVLFYVTSLEDSPVGGVALFRDRKRLGMVIASVVLSTDLRKRLLHSLIKSSLPFFRTAAIRDVDVLVAPQNMPSPLHMPPFPYSYILPYWVRSTLERLDFTPVEKIVYGVIQSSFAPRSGNVSWDTTIDEDVVQKLAWDQRHLTGFDSSFMWLSLVVGLSTNSIKSVTMDDKLVLVIGYALWGDVLVVGSLVWDSDRVDDTFVAAAIVKLARELKTTSIHLHLHEKNRHLFDLLTTSRPLVCEVNLYRKLL